MDQATMQHYKEKLLAERENLLDRIKNADWGATELDGEKQALAVPQRDAIGELSAYDNHPADLGTETFERSKDLALRQKAEIEITEVDQALQRIKEGTFGSCTKCGRAISQERLEALPSTAVCLECKREEEELPDRHPRPIEEDVIMMPFGGMALEDNEDEIQDDSEFESAGGEDQNEFDGEDAWQAVARYGTSESPQDISVHGVDDFNHMYVDADEDVGYVEGVDSIAYDIDNEGRYLEDFEGLDDESVRMPDMLEGEEIEDAVERTEKFFSSLKGHKL